MPDELDDQLSKLAEGQSKKIRGLTVRLSDGCYIVSGKAYSYDGAISILSKKNKTADKDVMILAKPYTKELVSIHPSVSKEDRSVLLKMARDNGLYLYTASVIERDNKYYAVEPWAIDWDSVPDCVEDMVDEIDSIKCPYCNKEMASKSGRTLHVKSQHPDKYENYKKLI